VTKAILDEWSDSARWHIISGNITTSVNVLGYEGQALNVSHDRRALRPALRRGGKMTSGMRLRHGSRAHGVEDSSSVVANHAALFQRQSRVAALNNVTASRFSPVNKNEKLNPLVVVAARILH
jgi:hypothetical protein